MANLRGRFSYMSGTIFEVLLILTLTDSYWPAEKACPATAAPIAFGAIVIVFHIGRNHARHAAADRYCVRLCIRAFAHRCQDQRNQAMDLTERKSHFEFGQNWKDYATTIDQNRIESAVEGLKKLFPDGLAGKTFLDIGCGSGLHSLAALSLGAASVLATDIDENSVSTTRAVLSRAPKASWDARVISVFDMTPETIGQFDVVYSWGVLHHTGAMWRAIETAAKLVKPRAEFALAIYSKTPLDAAWKLEKRIYSGGPRALQWIIRQAYLGALFSTQALRGRNPMSLSSNAKTRGMNFYHDVHDWLGGFPYETASANELHDRVCSLGFSEERSFRIPISIGIFSSGCHEFVFRAT